MNPAFNCVLTITHEMSGDTQGRMPILSLLHATQVKLDVMVLGAISLDIRTPLTSIRCKFTAQQWIDNIVRLASLAFFSQNPNFIFQKVNGRLRMARVTMNSLNFNQTLSSPLRSRDLSPIVHVWNMMGSRLQLPGIVDDLARQLEPNCQEILQEILRELYLSILRLMAASIQARVGSTPIWARFCVTM